MRARGPVSLLILVLKAGSYGAHFGTSSGAVTGKLVRIVRGTGGCDSRPFRLLVVSPVRLNGKIKSSNFSPRFSLASRRISERVTRRCQGITARCRTNFLSTSGVTLPDRVSHRRLSRSNRTTLTSTVCGAVARDKLLRGKVSSSFYRVT